LFNSVRNAGWFIKPAWGYLSDQVPLFGYRRKSWYVLMALLAVLFWAVNAGLTYVGVRSPPLFLVTFNLAFAAYAFVNVVCDALMVTYGRQLKCVGSFVNFQWTILAAANAGSMFLGGWLQEQVEAGEIPLSLIFLVTGIPPLLTGVVGLRIIAEPRVHPVPPPSRRPWSAWPSRLWRGTTSLPEWLRGIPAGIAGNRTIATLALFMFFWKFSPSIGYIERSYLIDVRHFDPAAFGIIVSAGSLTFLASILTYRWMVQRFRGIAWSQYFYATVAIGVLSFPMSFFRYLDPQHPWWNLILWWIPDCFNLIAGWNRYEWFRLVTQTILGFATIPAFLIPLTSAGETVKMQSAGVSYAFLMSLANVTDLFEGAIGAGLYKLFTLPALRWLLAAFHGSPFDIVGVSDERTLILEIFVYISLTFTLLTVPFVELLRRELARHSIAIDLAGRGD
jgi:hypothetical protein